MSKALALQTLTCMISLADLNETTRIERHIECSVGYWSSGVCNLNTGCSWDVF